MAPVLIGVMGLGIDVSYWTTTRTQLQRIVDVAAMAGAARYASVSDSSKAVITAADVAELNGLPAGTRSTSANSVTESYGDWSAIFTFASSPATVTATLQRKVSPVFSAIALSSKVAIGARAVAQVGPRSDAGQACVLALAGYPNGITTPDDIIVSGNVSITLNGCDLRSDASMQFNGNVSLNVPHMVASGTIDTKGNVTTCPQGQTCLLTGQPKIPDPFSDRYGPLLSVPSSIVSQPPGATISPPPAGTAYSSLSFNGGTIKFMPGIYYVAGSVSFGGNVDVSGAGVTIITGGGLTETGNTSFNLTAPTTGPTAGLLYGTSSNADVKFSGNIGEALRGAIYAPNSSVTVTGNSDTALNAACLAIVTNTITFSGNNTTNATNSGCTAMGVPTISDEPNIARLVQ
jgi:hypothetical protein